GFLLRPQRSGPTPNSIYVAYSSPVTVYDCDERHPSRLFTYIPGKSIDTEDYDYDERLSSYYADMSNGGRADMLIDELAWEYGGLQDPLTPDLEGELIRSLQ